MIASPKGPRIERIELNGHFAWRKYPEVTRTNKFAVMHRMLKSILPPALQPTNAPGGIESLHAEVERLQLFADSGICVPEVLENTNCYITLADCGPQLRGVLRKKMSCDMRVGLLKQAVRTVALLHTKGLAHGRPHLKDMTLKETAETTSGIIYLLDLEEDPTTIMGIKNAQARDVWLLLSSCAEFCDRPKTDLHELLSVYQNESTADHTSALRELGRNLRPFRRFIGAVRATNISDDVRGPYWATRVLETL